MVGSIGRLFGESIDFAGTFPPAGMELRESFDRYVRYASGPERWILSRFSCASSDLEDLARLVGHEREGHFVPVAVVASPPANRAVWEETLAIDSVRMNQFDSATPGNVEIASYEIRLPDEVAIESYLKDLRGFSEVDVFVEVPFSDNLERTLAALAETDWAYAKARVGSDPAPESEKLARFVSECLSLDLPFKLTAGMHSPISGDTSYGFINLFGGAALAVSEDLSRRELEGVFRDQERVNWHFDQTEVRYKSWTAGLDSIVSARDLLLCFGSCSLEEPITGLASIGVSVPGEITA